MVRVAIVHGESGRLQHGDPFITSERLRTGWYRLYFADWAFGPMTRYQSYFTHTEDNTVCMVSNRTERSVDVRTFTPDGTPVDSVSVVVMPLEDRTLRW